MHVRASGVLARPEAAALLSHLPPVLLECVLECLGYDARDELLDATVQLQRQGPWAAVAAAFWPSTLAAIGKAQAARRGSLQRWGPPAQYQTVVCLKFVV